MLKLLPKFIIMAFERNIPFNELPNLPPADFVESPEILRHLAKAARHLGELNGLCASLPDPQILINTIILQESKESSAIENIVTTQDELYKAAAEDNTSNLGAKEVLNYKEALYVGLKRMRDQKNLLLTNTMVEIVQTIKQNDAGIRNESIQKLSALEQFINDPTLSALDPLIKMAFIHYQFEAIHPFADGNGRTGRILNALYLVQQDLLIQPVLYLSSYIVNHKADYYQLLRSVTEKENWNDWIMYMLTALIETTQLTTKKIKAMLSLKSDFETNMKLVLGSSFSYELLQLMFTLPYLKIDLLVNKEIAHRQTASTWLKKLTDADIVRPKKMGRTTYYINYRLMEILSSNYL
ncbi:MAG: Fic family protein [Sediminibacterium sp.]|nr:Fic family protein [Sediminibacterium sp.]